MRVVRSSDGGLMANFEYAGVECCGFKSELIPVFDTEQECVVLRWTSIRRFGFIEERPMLVPFSTEEQT